MRRLWLALFFFSVLTTFWACSGSQQAVGDGHEAAPGDTCPIVDPGPPPVCPEGCVWDGDACRKHSGIIVYTARDGGSPPPTPTGTNP